MRVTKTIREFIEREVGIRLAPKYEAEKQEAKRQIGIEHEIYEACLAAMQEACNKVLDKAITDHGFFEDLRPKSDDYCVELRKYRAFRIRGFQDYPSVHCYQLRMADEARKIVDEIIVELELGGDKAKLMEMLNEVGRA